MVRVSVIIPVYNTEQYIEECLDSVLNQTMNDLEIICIDDGSIDKSLHVLKQYQLSDSRVRILSQNNQGSGPARNRGMQEAHGKYVVFLDADDFWYDDFVLEKIVNAAEENESIITGAFWGTYKDCRYTRSWLHSKYFENGIRGKWIHFREEQECMGYCSYLYQREFLLGNDIFFPSYYRFQDPPFLTEALLKAEKYYVVPVDWHCYRTIYKNSLSTNRRTTDFVKGVIDVMEIAQKHHLEKLFSEMIRQLNEFSQCIINSILKGNTEMLVLLGQIQKYTVGREHEVEPVQFLQNAMNDKCKLIVNNFLGRLESINTLVIYGAGKYGHFLLEWLGKLNIDLEIVFAETKCVEGTMVDGKKCIQIDRLAEIKEKMLVIIAATPDTQLQMAQNLKYVKIENYLFLNRDLMTALECMGSGLWEDKNGE